MLETNLAAWSSWRANSIAFNDRARISVMVWPTINNTTDKSAAPTITSRRLNPSSLDRELGFPASNSIADNCLRLELSVWRNAVDLIRHVECDIPTLRCG